MTRKVIGADEVGRGCGSGPIVGCACYFYHPSKVTCHLADSKKLSEKQRTEIFSSLCDLKKEGVLTWKVIEVDAATIDKIGIQKSNAFVLHQSAMALAKEIVGDLADSALEVIIDGNIKIPPIQLEKIAIIPKTIIKADASLREVSAASIIAKVIRDKLMQQLDKQYPVYGWKKNKGYLSKAHREAIQQHGPTKFHRISFIKSWI